MRKIREVIGVQASASVGFVFGILTTLSFVSNIEIISITGTWFTIKTDKKVLIEIPI